MTRHMAAVGVLCQHMLNPGKQHWVGTKRALRYIKGTLDYSSQCKTTNIDGVMNSLRGYADAAWTRNMTMRKSTSAYVFQIETKYMTLSNTKQEAIWLQTLPNAMGFDQAKPTTMFEDKQGAIELAKNPSHHSETKHINIKFHHVRDAVVTKKIDLQYCPTQEIIVDRLMKGLWRPEF